MKKTLEFISYIIMVFIGVIIIIMLVNLQSCVNAKTKIARYEYYFIRDEWTAYTNSVEAE